MQKTAICNSMSEMKINILTLDDNIVLVTISDIFPELILGHYHCTVYLFCASCGTTGGSFGVLKTTLRGIFWRKVLDKSCWYCYYPLLIWKITEKWSKGKIFKKYILGGLGNTPLEGILEKKFQAKVVCIHFPSTYQK